MDKSQTLSKVSEEITKIKDLTENRSYNTICTVETIYPWIQSKGKDLVFTLKVFDDSCTDSIFIKVFRNKRTFLHGFNKGDKIKVTKFRYYKGNFYLLDKEGNIEIIESHKNDIKLLEKTRSQLHPTRKIKDLQYPENIKFTGKLILKQIESYNIVILGFIDNTINHHIKNLENKAFYKPNMILYVRAWDSMAVKALNLKENSVYCLENLRVKIEITKLIADLSENARSKITEVTNQLIIDEIKSRSIISKEKVINFSEHLYIQIKLVKVNEITVPGHYKIQVKILRHHPPHGQYISVCTLCKITQKESIFRCECGSKPIKFLLVKYLVRDESGDCVLISKDNVAESMLSRVVTDQKIELLVYSDYKEGKLYTEIRDIPNFANI